MSPSRPGEYGYRDDEEAKIAPEQWKRCPGKNERSEVSKPRRNQQPDNESRGPTMRRRYERIKTPADVVGETNCDCEVDQSKHTAILGSLVIRPSSAKAPERSRLTS